MIGGTAIVCACLFVLGWTTEIVEFFTPKNETVCIKESSMRLTCSQLDWQNQSRVILFAVLSIYGVDFAINAVQASCRSLIVDTLPIEKQQTGSAWGKLHH